MVHHQQTVSNQKISFACIAVFAVVFLASSITAHFLNPRDNYFASFPAWDVKYNYLVNNDHPVDLIAIGNSHIYRHFSPQAFENQMQLTGRKSSTVNIGVPNLSVVELPVLLEAIKQRGEKPKIIIVDPFIGTGSEENWFTIREIKNNSFNNFVDMLAFDFDKSNKLSKSLNRAGHHFLSFLGNAFNVGMLNRFVYENQDHYIEAKERAPDMVNDKGFIAVDFDNDQATQIISSKKYGNIKKNVNQPINFNENYIGFFEVVYNRILAMGATPIFITTPTMSYREVLRRKAMITAFQEKQPTVKFFDYSDLFIENEYRTNVIWFDGGHLTLKGATIFSQRLADDVSKIGE